MSSEEQRNDSGIGRDAWLTVLGVTLARIVYLIVVCPYELAGDEAQYWDWSRPQHLSLSYVSKGPGIAWLIAASTRLFGDVEWAIRLPAALSTGVAMLAVAALARRIGGSKAAFLAVLAFCSVPVYSATALLMTIDAPFIACWLLACLAAWSLRENATTGKWLALAACLGVGFLFKYTILLLVPGLLIWSGTERERAIVTARTIGQAALALTLFALLVSPVTLWNQRHGWPALAHLLGRVSVAGGDSPVGPRHYEARWTLELLAAQLGLIGPILLLVLFSLTRAWRNRFDDPKGWQISRFALSTSSPILLFYLGVSFLANVEGNWPVAGYATLLVPAALYVMTVKSRTIWRWSLGYGAVAFIALFSMQMLDRVPWLTRAIPYHRISGHRAYAQRVAATTKGSDASFIVADHYSQAALLAYYVPGHPVVRSASSFLGGRRSAYDFFDDTSLRDPALLGRPALLIGATPVEWRRAFRFDSIQQPPGHETRGAPVYIGSSFGGPTAP